MSTPIKTNQLVYILNHKEIDKNYDIFTIKTTKNFWCGAYILIDAPLLESNVCSVRFLKGKTFYVLMHHDTQNKKRLQKTIANLKDGDTITIEPVKSSELEDWVLLQLLLNSLGSTHHPLLKFNNLTGHLYCFHPDWINKNKDVIWKIPCLELSLTPECRLQLNVRTFTSVLLKHQMTFKKKKFEDYPRYVLSTTHNTLRRKLKEDEAPVFIQRQVDGKKTNIDFLNVINFEQFSKSKMGILSETVLRFNEVFKNMAHIDFDEISEYTTFDGVRYKVKEDKDFIKEKLQTQTIRIVDTIDNEESKLFCKKMKEYLLEEYQITSKIGKRIYKDCLNLRLIHDAAYYQEENDPHQEQHPGIIIQHITLENFAGNVKNATSTVIHELLIRSDLQKGKIRLFDWTKLGLTEDISFGISEDIDEAMEHYFFMCIRPDGTFSIKEQEASLFEQTEYSQCAEIFLESKKSTQPVRGIIRDSHGNINTINDTGWFTIPEIFSIREELENKNTAIRNREKRELLFTSVIDIKYFQKDNSTYYFAGEIGNGMSYKLHTAVNIRKIKPYEDAPLLFDNLLPLMNVPFVRNKQLTVLPFPFKYLREYVQQLKNKSK